MQREPCTRSPRRKWLVRYYHEFSLIDSLFIDDSNSLTYMETIMPILLCSDCGQERKLTDGSYYEAKRKGVDRCRSCALKAKKPRGSKYDSLISKGDVFGKRTVISDQVSTDGAWVECKCECGSVSRVRAATLLAGKATACKQCCRGKDSTNWKGVGSLPATVVTKIKLRAKGRNIDFDLSKEYLWDLYLRQKKKCALSGLEIDFGLDDPRNLSDYTGTASLDRIDSSVGYVEGNVQWTHVHVNLMKLDHDEIYFKRLCRMVTEYDQSRNT